MLFDNIALPSLLQSDSPEVLTEFYQLYLQHTGQVVEQLCGQTPAMDFPAIRDQAHSIKSSSLSLGAYRLAEELVRLEHVAGNLDAAETTDSLKRLRHLAQQTFYVIHQELECLAQNLTQNPGGRD